MMYLLEGRSSSIIPPTSLSVEAPNMITQRRSGNQSVNARRSATKKSRTRITGRSRGAAKGGIRFAQPYPPFGRAISTSYSPTFA